MGPRLAMEPFLSAIGRMASHCFTFVDWDLRLDLKRGLGARKRFLKLHVLGQ